MENASVLWTFLFDTDLTQYSDGVVKRSFSFHLLFLSRSQRPTAKELLKHKLIVRYAKKTSYLTELIDRYKQWKVEQCREDSSSDDSDSYADDSVSFVRFIQPNI